MSEKTFRYCMSPRCFRYKEDAILAHAPQTAGVFEFVTFDEQNQAQILYVGLAEKSIAQDLAEHLKGVRSPMVADLLQRHPNLYFDCVEWSDAQSGEDLKDIAAALYGMHKPSYNLEPLSGTGRYQAVKLHEAEIPLFRPT